MTRIFTLAAIVLVSALGLAARASDDGASKENAPARIVREMQAMKTSGQFSTLPAGLPSPFETSPIPVPPMKAPGPAGGEVVDGIEVTGTPAFIRQTKSALALLKKSAQYEDIRSSLGVIAEGRCSGMWVYATKPTFYVGRGTWEREGLLWYAGSIAHDSMHSKLYHDEKKRLNGAEPQASVWSGSQAEKLCMFFQSGVLEELGADKETLDFLAKSIGVTIRLTDAPTYQNIGAGNPDVCAKRDW